MNEPGKAVFLSYASQDTAAAKKICEALRAAGIEVWFDQSELVGGDQWDQKIRKQIRDCTLMIPIISENSQARTEGYFRLEWRLADQRTHLMAKGRAFLLPVVIDDTHDSEAHVPDSFTDVQWTRLPGGETTPAFCTRVKELLDVDPAPRRRPSRFRRQSSSNSRPGSDSPPSTRKHWAVALLGGLVIATLALVIVRPWSKNGATPAQAETLSELAKVRARIIPDRWQKGDFEAFSPAIDRLIRANPEDAEAWALRSIINSLQVTRLIDPGTKPLEAGRTAAERALRLAPESALGHLALAMHLTANVSRGADPEAGREPVERALATLPPDALTRYAELVSRWFGYDFENTERSADAWLEVDPTAQYPAWVMTSLSVTLRRPHDVEKWAARAFRGEDVTSVRAMCNRIDACYFLSADLAAARRVLEDIPRGSRTMVQVVYWRWLLAMSEKRWDEALQILAQVPDAMLLDVAYTGPKALLAGMAHQRAGRTDAAALQYREAERLLREALTGDPDNEALREMLAVTLASAGRADEARRELALVEPLVRGRAPNYYRSRLVVSLAHAYGALGDFKSMAFWLRKLLAEPSSVPLTPASLRLDPRLNVAIDAPEIQALLKEFASLDQPGKQAGQADKRVK